MLLINKPNKKANKMKKTVLTALTVVIASAPLVAADRQAIRDEFQKQFREKYDVILRVGVDALGGKDDTKVDSAGVKTGVDRSMGFELLAGAEEKVENFEWGSRRMMSLYSYGNATYYNGAYEADINNAGIETTGASYVKLTQYFKPYVGLGLGLNINSYNDHGAYQKSDDYQLTVHAVGGVSGELFTGIGYYAEYKYRFAPSETLQITPKTGGGIIEIENEGVNGGVFMAGLSYQF